MVLSQSQRSGHEFARLQIDRSAAHFVVDLRYLGHPSSLQRRNHVKMSFQKNRDYPRSPRHREIQIGVR
jgi:hypothetical protein